MKNPRGIEKCGSLPVASCSRRRLSYCCQVRLLEMTLRDFKDYVALSHRGSTRKALAGMVTLEEELWKRHHAQREANTHTYLLTPSVVAYMMASPR